jgi:hypothetical protein
LWQLVYWEKDGSIWRKSNKLHLELFPKP